MRINKLIEHVDLSKGAIKYYDSNGYASISTNLMPFA